MVVPISLKANLPISGNSLNVSIANGLTGLILTTAASPVFKNLGFSSTTPPVFESILATNSESVAATWAVCACSTWRISGGHCGRMMNYYNLCLEFFDHRRRTARSVQSCLRALLIFCQHP